MKFIPLQSIADELGVPFQDVFVVAESEILDSDMFDDDREAVTPHGRRIIVAHFYGGIDPSEVADI